MRFTTFLFLTLTLCLSSACERKDSIVKMHFNETGCANPWNKDSDTNVGFNNNDPDYQNKVRNYLIQFGIDIKEISISNDGPLSGCFSCFCTTGRKINISIFEKDKSLAKELGFI